MAVMTEKWSENRLAEDAAKSIASFKESRIDEPEEQYIELFVKNFARVQHVIDASNNLLDLESEMPGLLGGGYYDVVRYLTAPPVSADDMKVLAELTTKDAPSKLKLPDNSSKVYRFVMRTLDVKRFGWVMERREPSAHEMRVALVSTSALLATQRMQTERKMAAKRKQEGDVRLYLIDKMGYTEVPTRVVSTAFDAPKAHEFCGESSVDGTNADFVIGLGDNRFMCMECKVSNSETNSFKRLNHEVVEKVVHWYESFGKNGVVCVGLLKGVFKVDNLKSAQAAGASIFWSHGLDELGKFIQKTYQ